MLEYMGRRFHDIVIWRVAVQAYQEFDITASNTRPTMRSKECSRGAVASFTSFSRLSRACASSRSASVSPLCVLFSSFGVPFAAGAIVAHATVTVLRMSSSSIVSVVGETSYSRNGPIMMDSSLLHDLFASCSEVDVVIDCHLRYTFCPTSTFFDTFSII